MQSVPDRGAFAHHLQRTGRGDDVCESRKESITMHACLGKTWKAEGRQEPFRVLESTVWNGSETRSLGTPSLHGGQKPNYEKAKRIKKQTNPRKANLSDNKWNWRSASLGLRAGRNAFRTKIFAVAMFQSASQNGSRQRLFPTNLNACEWL